MKAPKVYILHGWVIDPHTKRKWIPFMEALKKLGVSTHFLSIPGLDTKLTESWTLSQYETWLAETLPKKPVILLGHSFGGQLAVRFAANHPDRVAQLVLIGPAGIRDYTIKAVFKRSIFYVAAKVGKVFANNPTAKRVLYKLAREHDYESAPPLMKQTMQAILSDEIRADLPRLACPVIVVWGKEDRATPYKNVALYRQYVADVHVCTITDARHSPHFTHIAQTARCIAPAMSALVKRQAS